MNVRVTLAEAEALALKAMLAHGFAEAVARPAATALLMAERDGLA
jgi:LDH2 family malate/lactate/ureidoglycolate dehydrogenase